MKKALLFLAVALSVIFGLLALYVAGWVIFATDTTDCDCSKGEAVAWGVGQLIAGLALLAGAFGTVTRRVRLATVSWIVAIVAGLVAFFWIWPVAVPVAIILALGIWAVRDPGYRGVTLD